jgi:SNF2 family DNA or RNA helicase
MFKTKPFEHQLEALRRMDDQRAYALLMEQGTGKTKCLIDDAARLYGKGQVNALVVIAPNGVHRNWIINEIPAHLPDWAPRKCAWWASSMKVAEKKAFDALFATDDCLRVFTMNIEALATKKGVEALTKLLKTFNTYLVVDESSKIKNHQAVRTKNLLKIGQQAKYRRIATGTPVTQSPLDVYTQFAFLDEEIINIPSYFVFKARYAELVDENSHIMRHIMQRSGARRAPQLVAKDKSGKPMYKNMDELQSKVAKYSYRVLKKDCLDLPEKLYQRRYFELSDEQQRFYKQIVEDLRIDFEDGETVTMSKLTAVLRLQQINSGFVTNAENALMTICDVDKNPRIQALAEELEEVTGKVIIWARFTQDIKNILTFLNQTYGPQSAVAYYGAVDDDTRAANVKAFQENDNVRFFIGNQQAGGTGLTLTAASTVIYYSNDFNLENRLQSEDRAHRIGQKNNVTYVDIEAVGTVDTRIINALRTKKDVASLITNDPWTEWI